MNTEDFQRAPCPCELCTVAGVSSLPQRRDPFSGAWMHGRELAAYYRAKQAFREAFKRHVVKDFKQPKGGAA